MTVASSWAPGQSIRITRLTGPGTNAKSSVSVSGVTFNPSTGDRVEDNAEEEVVQVGDGGAVSFQLAAAEGILLQVMTNATASTGSGETSGASVMVGGP